MMELAMKTQARWAALLLAFVLVPAGCSDRKPDERQPPPAPRAAPAPAPEATPAPEQRPPTPSTPEPAPEPRAGKEPAPATKPPATPPEPARPEPTKPEPAQPEPAEPEPATPEPARPQEPAPATPSTPQKPVATEAGKTMASDVVILTGAPLGGVRLAHTLHAERAGNACTTCHHPSRPEKPATAPQQACSACHTKVAAAPMKTKYQAAFHNPTAQSGTCIDCHKAENAKGQNAPVKCAECHKKENR